MLRCSSFACPNTFGVVCRCIGCLRVGIEFRPPLRTVSPPIFKKLWEEFQTIIIIIANFLSSVSLPPNGDIAVSSKGKYLKLAIGKITQGDFTGTDWFLLEGENDPKQIKIPEKGILY